MQHNTRQYSERLDMFQQDALLFSLKGIQHGVERESLRINANGSLAKTDHQRALGSALTHRFITTDFAEPLLEFITPPEPKIKTTLAQLIDTHKYTIQNIGDERLWPMSMPCYISNEDDIRLAEYGSSNIGKMKHLYRKGLKNRYGSMMQTISGIHFNFSLSADFWHEYLPRLTGKEATQDAISAAYFGMIRNYRRYCWMLPYLYGASPVMCQSFLGDNSANLEFKKIGRGSLYLPNATSLRMSDLGYTNDAQSGLRICYNFLDTYIDTLRKAIQTPSPQYQHFSGKHNGEFQQLNGNVLQIENELYSPIRPKQPTISMERPTDALAERGVSYIEVRVLDVNPFSPVGITEQQMRFLDVFLLFCLLQPSDKFNKNSYAVTERNIEKVVLEGRNPELKLESNGHLVLLRELGTQIVDEMMATAQILDKANGTDAYSQALLKEKAAIEDPDLTLSGRMMNDLLGNGQEKDNGEYGLELAERYRQHFTNTDYQIYDEAFFRQQAEHSVRLQTQIETEDHVGFDEFMRENFGV